jgi:hypothetical protein
MTPNPPTCPACGTAHAPGLTSERGAYYWCNSEQRTRLYITGEASRRAWKRGERLSQAEYRALTTIEHSATRGARRIR